MKGITYFATVVWVFQKLIALLFFIKPQIPFQGYIYLLFKFFLGLFIQLLPQYLIRSF